MATNRPGRRVRISGNVVSDASLDAPQVNVNGTALTATAAELNTLAGVTAGTVSASKTLVADSNRQLTGLRRPVLTKNANYTVAVGDSGAVMPARSA